MESSYSSVFFANHYFSNCRRQKQLVDMKNKWKIIVSVCVWICMAQLVSAQGVGIKDNNTAPDVSAILDVSSADKGVLVPRMTAAQK